jgi:hypothetical protein
LFPDLGVGRQSLRLHDGHDRIGGVGEEFTVALEFVEVLLDAFERKPL